ncbi:MAG: TetR/AcrR family transcriptional regulator [Dehalobacterium sp.]
METKKDSRQLILDAALMLFSKKGFSATTTREIAKEAGFAEGTLFRYFPTKKDILIALVEPHALEELHRTISRLPNKGEEENLHIILENRLTTISKNKNLIKVIMTEAQFHEEFKEDIMKNIGCHVLDTIAGYMAKRIESGVFREADPMIVSRILIGMMISLLLSEGFYPMKDFDDKKSKEYLDEIINIFLYGVKKKGDENL